MGRVRNQGSPARRPVMHAAMARGLVQCEPNRQGEIARHWHEAGDGEKEFVALLEAGGAAQRIGAITEAGDFFQRALALWDELPEPAGLSAWQWPRLVEETSALLIQSRRFQAAYRLTQRALEQRRQFGAGDQCRLLSAAGEAMFYNDAEPLTDLRAVFAFFQGAVEHLDESVEPKTAISLLSRFGTHAMQQGRDEEGLRAIERAVRMARASDNSRLLWFALLWRAIWRARAGDAGAEDDLVEVASIRRRLGETLPVVGIAAAHDYLGQAQAALRVGLSASEWCVEHGQAGVRGYQVEELIGRSLERLGRFDQVIERYEKLCERIGRDQVEGWPDMEMMAFGIAFARSGQTAEAAAMGAKLATSRAPTTALC